MKQNEKNSISFLAFCSKWHIVHYCGMRRTQKQRHRKNINKGGELPELAIPPVPLEELPGNGCTSLINLGKNVVCLCTSLQWLAFDTKTGKRLLRGFRKEGSAEPIAVRGKLYEFDFNTITFTLLLDISKP